MQKLTHINERGYSLNSIPADIKNAPFVDKEYSSKYFGIRPRVALLTLILLVTIGLVTWEVVSRSQQLVIEYQAVELVEVVAQLATTARSVYNAKVINKLKQDGFGAHQDYKDHKGFVPLPAQFLKEVGLASSQNIEGLYRYRPVSKWNLEETQGLDNDFLRWAWPQLEAQDQANPAGPITWKPVWRVEELNGVTTLRYLRADPASSSSCVGCHNAIEMREDMIARRKENGVATGKQWRLHQLLGAIEVDVPLNKVEALAQDQRYITSAMIIGVILLGSFVIAFFVLIDVTKARSMAKQLSWQAFHDVLTGLVNRPAFEYRLNEAIKRAKVDQSHHGLLLIDLDQFKIVNDTCGHMAGDQLLKEVAALIKPLVRDHDTLARFGGDEFGVLLDNCPEDKAHEIAEKILDALRDYRFTWQNKIFEIGASIGLVCVTQTSQDSASLLSAADLACYAAKDEGRNQIYALSLTDLELSKRRAEMEWPSKINRALEQKRISLVVQDAISECDGIKPKYYKEILLRMVDESGLPVPTGFVISVAERFNVIGNLDRWVVTSVFQAIVAGNLEADQDHVIAINLSGQSFNDRGFLEFVKSQFETYPDINPQHICFEITETAVVQNLSKTIEFIDSLKTLGCQFALDDFGSGSSSFEYLKTLPVDYLKIDGSFVRDILTDKFDNAMVESIAKIGNVTGLLTIAEWVENDAIAEHVKALGIHYLQGFGVHKPEPFDIPSE
ncbi:MAG: EAL domain-containing protein [Gammaproteobacteria bacterium]|nr:EAL domain-containing protein [Gammaproteobacteria bacterium]